MKKAITGSIAVSVQKKVRIVDPKSPGNANGSNLAQLSSEEKEKISKLVERVLELGRENEALRASLETARRRREEDIAVAVGIIRAELQKKHEEVEDLQTKRLGALELLHRYQQKISELADNLRLLQRRETEHKTQLVGYKTELNNLQQLLETQSQTIQSYRLQVSAASTVGSGRVGLEEVLRKRELDLKAAEANIISLEDNIQQLHEQLSTVRHTVHEKDKQIVELNAVILSLSLFKEKEEMLKKETTNLAESKEQMINIIDFKPIPSKEKDWSETGTGSIEKSHRSVSAVSTEFNGDPRSGFATSLKDEDFISHLERIAKEKKERKAREKAGEIQDFDSVVSSPPLMAPSPPFPVPVTAAYVSEERGRPNEGTLRAQNDLSTLHFDESFSTIDHTPETLPRVKRSKSPNSVSRMKSTKKSGESDKMRKVQPHQSLSSSASTLLKTVSRNVNPQQSFRQSYNSKENSRSKSISNEAQSNMRVKFGAKVDRGHSDISAKDITNNAKHHTSDTGGLHGSPSSPGSMYDPVLFDLLDEMDAHDNSTISSISRHYEVGGRW